MFLGGLLERKIGPRFSTLFGCGIMSLGVLLSYIAIKVSYWLLLLTYGLMFGLGVGIAYVGPLASAVRWMPRWKGVAAGLVLAGFGLGALIFDPIQTVFINPDNLSSDGNGYFLDDDLLDRVPEIFLILGGIYAVLQIVGSLMIVDPPEETDDTEIQEEDEEANINAEEHVMSRADNYFRNEKKSDHTSEDSVSKPSHRSPEPDSESPSGTSSPSHGSRDSISSIDEESRLIPRHLNVQQATTERKGHGSDGRSPLQEKMKTFSKVSDLESSTTSTASLRSNTSRNVMAEIKPLLMLKKANFYVLWLMMLLAGFAVFFTATLYKFFGLTFIQDDHFLAIVGSAGSISNCAGRIVWGLIADRISYKFALVLQSGIMTVFLLTLYATSVVGKSMFFLWVCIIFFCIGGVFSLFPTAIARSFGSKYMSMNYGLLFTSQIISSVMAALLFSVLHHLLDWAGIIFLVSGVCLTGFVFTLFFHPKNYVILDV